MEATKHLIGAPSPISFPVNRERSGGVLDLQELKKLSKSCLLAQFGASYIYFFSSLLFPGSHSLAVTCGVLAILISLTPVFYAWSRSRFQILFSCISVFNFAPIWFLYLEAVLPGYDAFVYTKPVYRMEAFFWVSVFMIFINFFYLVLWKHISRISIKSFSFLQDIRLKPSVYAWLTILAFAIPMLGYYFYYGSGEKLWIWLTAGRSEKGEELTAAAVGSIGAFTEPLKWVMQLTPMFGAIAFVSFKNKKHYLPVISLILSILVVFIFFLKGSRGTMMFVAAPLLFFLFYYNWHKGVKFWITAGLMLFMIIGIMEFQVRFRGNLLDVIANPEKAAREHDLQSVTTFDPSKSHRDNNTYLFCLMIKGYPDKYEFTGFNDLAATLVNPIPRAIWPGKPMLGGSQDLDHQAQFILDGPLIMGTTSLTFSVVGEAYMAKGFFGLMVYALIFSLFMLFFDGIAYYTADRGPLAAGMLGVGVFLSFWGFRSLFALISFLYPIVFLIVAIRMFRMFKKVL